MCLFFLLQQHVGSIPSASYHPSPPCKPRCCSGWRNWLRRGQPPSLNLLIRCYNTLARIVFLWHVPPGHLAVLSATKPSLVDVSLSAILAIPRKPLAVRPATSAALFGACHLEISIVAYPIVQPSSSYSNAAPWRSTCQRAYSEQEASRAEAYVHYSSDYLAGSCRDEFSRSD